MNKSNESQLFRNGSIYTLNPDLPWAEAMVVSKGKIVQIGTTAELTACLIGENEVIDLEGRFVLPGFVDAHAHPSHAVEYFQHISLYQLRSIDQYLTQIQTFIDEHPGRDFYRGNGWDNALFPLHGADKGLLDQIEPETPMVFISYDYHSMWVNSAMLARCGITRDTPNPEGGVIEKDPKTGEPNGTLRESAMRLVKPVLPGFSLEERVQTLVSYQEMAFACGVTMCHDAMLDEAALEGYQALATQGELVMTFRGSLHIEHDKPLGEQIEELLEMRARHRHPRFQTNTAKLFVDGVVEGGTAYLLEAYANRPDYYGELIWEPGQLREACSELDKAGIQIHMHVIGDGAARIALDALEFARQRNGARDARHLITHLQLVHPQDILRFKQLGVVGLPNPYWFKVDEYYSNLALPYLGKQRADQQYPMRSFLEAGVPMASASDFPVTIPFDPLIGIQLGMRRASLDAPGSDVLWPDERVSLAEMIASFTIQGAYANFLEGQHGSLKVGKQADFIVLERNLFEIPPEEIASTGIQQTYVHGKEVFRPV